MAEHGGKNTENHGKSWNMSWKHGKSRKITNVMENHRKSRKIAENHCTRKITEHVTEKHGKSQSITEYQGFCWGFGDLDQGGGGNFWIYPLAKLEGTYGVCHFLDPRTTPPSTLDQKYLCTYGKSTIFFDDHPRPKP